MQIYIRYTHAQTAYMQTVHRNCAFWMWDPCIYSYKAEGDFVYETPPFACVCCAGAADVHFTVLNIRSHFGHASNCSIFNPFGSSYVSYCVRSFYVLNVRGCKVREGIQIADKTWKLCHCFGGGTLWNELVVLGVLKDRAGRGVCLRTYTSAKWAHDR